MKLTRRRLRRLISEALKPSVQEKIADMSKDQIDTAISEIENYSEKSMSRRSFLFGAVSLGIASALFGRSFLKDKSNRAELLAQLKNAKGRVDLDPRVQIASDWLDQFFGSATFAKSYSDKIEKNAAFYWGFLAASENIRDMQDIIIDYITHIAPEALFESLITEFEKAGYSDPFAHRGLHTQQSQIADQIDALIHKRIRVYYTPDRIKALIKRHTSGLAAGIYETVKVQTPTGKTFNQEVFIPRHLIEYAISDYQSIARGGYPTNFVDRVDDIIFTIDQAVGEQNTVVEYGLNVRGYRQKEYKETMMAYGDYAD